MRLAKLGHTIAAAALAAACASGPGGDETVGERVLPDIRVVAEHFRQALAQHGPYRIHEPAAPTWAAASSAAAKATATPSLWARLWPAQPPPAAAGVRAQPALLPALPAPAVWVSPAPPPAAAKPFSLMEHLWPPLASRDSPPPVASAPTRPPPAPPAAAVRPPAGKGSGLSEVRVGVLKHAVAFGGRTKEQGIDGNLEALFRSPAWLGWAFSPRPHLGLTLNASKRQTDFLYAGLTWEGTFRNAFFVDLGLGLSVHDGMLDNSTIAGKTRRDRREFGCRALFREALELGYRFLDRHSLSLLWEHHAHHALCGDKDEGIDNAGLRYGFRM